MTNVTDIVHILVGTYELLSFTKLNGQASRRGLPVHFPRYQLQREEDCTEFQAALLALLKKVPLHTDTETLVVKHWLYFYERCIGSVGVLKDWLLRAVSATLDEGGDMLTLERLQEHALSISQCEQMALDAIEGEQKLHYTEGRREHLWRLLQGEGILAPIPQLPMDNARTTQTLSSSTEKFPPQQESTTSPSPGEQPLSATKKRAGQQAPRRNPVGSQPPAEEKPGKCIFSGAVELSPAQLATSAIAKLQCPQCGAIWTARIRGETVSFPAHPPRTTTRATQAIPRWIRRGTAWEHSDKKA
jgi:hypothetical protein